MDTATALGLERHTSLPVGSVRVWRWLPYPLLAVSLALTIVEQVAGSTHRPLALVGALVVAAAAWTALVRHRAPDADAWAIGYFAGRCVLCLALVLIAPWFGIFAWYGYLEAMQYFRPRRLFAALGVAAAVTSFSYVGGIPRSGASWAIWAAVLVGSGVLVSYFALASVRLHGRNVERERTLTELRVANERLAAALAENRGLQEQLLAQAREAGVLDERTRLAGEIHDTLAQTLAGIVTQLDAAPAGGPAADRIARARSLATAGLTEARRTLSAMRPSELVDTRLADAMADTVTRWSAERDVAAGFDVSGEPAVLDTDTQIALLRVVQEGLANVARHANASKVGVTLSFLPDVVLLDVRDDGVGFDPHAGAAGAADGDGHHVGLVTMAERLRRVGGELSVETEPGGGVALTAQVPR